MDDYHVVGVTSNPTIFAKALAQGSAYDEQVQRPGGPRRRAWRRPPARSPPTTSAGPATCCARSTTPRRRGRPGVDRGRPAAGQGYGQDHRRGQERCGGWSTGPTPTSRSRPPGEGLPAITATHRRGHQRQRHADLLAGAVRRGHRRVHGRPGEGQGERARPVQDLLGGLVLRQPGGHRGRRAGWTSWARRRPRRCAARPPSRTPGWPTSCSRTSAPSERWQALAASGANVQRPLWAST